MPLGVQRVKTFDLESQALQYIACTFGDFNFTVVHPTYNFSDISHFEPELFLICNNWAKGLRKYHLLLLLNIYRPLSVTSRQPSVPSMLVWCLKLRLPSFSTLATSWKMASTSALLNPITSIAFCKYSKYSIKSLEFQSGLT